MDPNPILKKKIPDHEKERYGLFLMIITVTSVTACMYKRTGSRDRERKSMGGRWGRGTLVVVGKDQDGKIPPF